MTPQDASLLMTVVVLPFAVAFGLAAQGASGQGRAGQAGQAGGNGALLAAWGIAAGFLCAYLARRGLPPWPPSGVYAKLAYAMLASMAVAAVVERVPALAAGRLPVRAVATVAAVLLLPVAVTVWLATDLAPNPALASGWLTIAIWCIVGVMALIRTIEDQAKGLSSPIVLLMACAGLAVVANIYGSRLSLYATALTAAIGGHLVASLFGRGPRWSTAASLTAGCGYVALAAMLAMSRDNLTLPVGFTATVFFCRPLVDVIGRLIPLSRALETAVLVVFACAPVGGAAYAAYVFT